MIVLNRRTKVFFCREATDMRMSFDGLFNRVKDHIREDPFSGHLFVFLNKRRSTCKALIYDGTGVIVIAKRLEEGLFSSINPHLAGKIVLTQAEFSLFLEGADLNKRFIESPRNPRQGASKIDHN
jgi:transposase